MALRTELCSVKVKLMDPTLFGNDYSSSDGRFGLNLGGGRQT